MGRGVWGVWGDNAKLIFDRRPPMSPIYNIISKFKGAN